MAGITQFTIRSNQGKRVDALDAIAVGHHLDAEGRSSRLLAWRDPGSSTLTLEDVDLRAKAATLAQVGAQLALADLDLDGLVEVLSSDPTRARSEDKLRVHTWHPDGRLQPRVELAIPGGIDAIGVCPLYDGPIASVIVASGKQLMVFD